MCACVYVCLCVHVQVKEFDEVVFGVEDTGVKSLHRVYTACNSLQPRTHTGRKQPRSVPHGLHSVNTVCGDFTVTLPLHYRYITVTLPLQLHSVNTACIPHNTLQPRATQPATPCDTGCNPCNTHRLHPRMLQAATLWTTGKINLKNDAYIYESKCSGIVSSAITSSAVVRK